MALLGCPLAPSLIVLVVGLVALGASCLNVLLGNEENGVLRSWARAGVTGEGGSQQGQGFAFKLIEPGTMSYGDVKFCPGTREPKASKVRPLHPGFNPLLIIGVQKGGTTWLYHMLLQSRSIVIAEHQYPKGASWGARKEVGFFQAWPYPGDASRLYAGLFPSKEVRQAVKLANAQLDSEALSKWVNSTEVKQAADSIQYAKAFLDATPNYMLTTYVPPRVKQVAPHVRIVITLRDPVERAYSSYTMNKGRCEHGFEFELPCNVNSFLELVTRDLHPSEHSFGCFFDGQAPDGFATWHDCYKCHHPNSQSHNWAHCNRRTGSGQIALHNCTLPAFSTLDYSNYAAQIAWWLAFFPPEQILILTSKELHSSPKGAAKALNDILDHARLPDAQRFTAAMVRKSATTEFNGDYPSKEPAAVTLAKHILRSAQKRQFEDLLKLLNKYWPRKDWKNLL